jgi:PBP1b-binding outer membrane lipoprotein LpoB
MRILFSVLFSALLLSGCGSESVEMETSVQNPEEVTKTKILENCALIQEVTSAFTTEFALGNYTGAAEALVVTPGSLSTITQTEEESNLINAITLKMPSVVALLRSGEYQDAVVLEFLQAVSAYSMFCLNLNFSE